MGARPDTALRDAAIPITGADPDHDALLDRIGDARVVLLGEGSHGTHEFYAARRRITRLLIERKGFTAVAVEADWPDAYRVNRYVRGVSSDDNADEALSGFRRFPTWMWRNRDVLELVEWLRMHNDDLPEPRRVGFYGLDLYSLHASMAAVVEYLDTIDPEAAQRARYRYSCFDHFGEDSQAYGYAAGFGMTEDCENQVVDQLQELRSRAAEPAHVDGWLPRDEHFFAEQNARLVRNAEQYYRAMFQGRVRSWNLRDRHMTDTLDALLDHFDRKAAQGGGGDGAGNGGRPARSKVVVWAHNSHLGDARATEMGERGEWNVGQLARERWGAQVVNVGFTTHAGTVTAATDWDRPALRRRVRPSMEGSYERMLHDVGIGDFLLPLWKDEVRTAVPARALERAIGVIYRPEMERVSHYFAARLADQFDAVIHFDETRALDPLERNPEWVRGEDDVEAPETYPSGI